MEEIEKNEEDAEKADLMCGDCVGEFMQIEHNENKPRLFSLKGYMKWFYKCNKCGIQTKLFINKIKK